MGAGPITELPPNVQPLPLIDHPEPLDALPVSKSNVVAIGVVNDYQPYLSSDKTGVYTEFVVTIETVLKDDSGRNLSSDSQVLVERAGGHVRLPTGRTMEIRIKNSNLPEIGKRYILFLRAHSEGDSLSIVTGYELQDGAVFPLDEKERYAGSRLPYFGADENSFLQALKARIQ